MDKSHEDRSKSRIDFELDQEFYDSLAEEDLQRYETYLFFFPISCLKNLYNYLDEIIDKNYAQTKNILRQRGFLEYFPPRFLSSEDIDAPVYRFIYAIMRNDIETAKRLVNEGKVDVNQPVLENLLLSPFMLAPRPFEKNIVDLTPLNVSAALGRHEIFRILIEKGADPGVKIGLISVKAYYIFLSVNECLLMNAIFQWYKSGRKTPISPDRAKNLIDSIILAGNACPSLVSYDHLIENTIRVTWYWGELKKMIGDQNLLKRLVPLNPPVINELFGF